MRRCLPAIWGCLALLWSQTGCDAPEQLVQTTPPGAIIPRPVPEGDDVAQALGESHAAAKLAGKDAAKLGPDTPAASTAKGETKTTKGGVRYETLKEGTGKELKSGHVAYFHYVGTLDDGRVFESTRDKNKPFEAAIGTGKLIKGWEEAMPGMKVGEIRKLHVPAALAYGDQDRPKIPPNSDLNFEVELLEIRN